MKRISILCFLWFALIFCSAGVTDEFFHGGKPKDREYEVAWDGPGDSNGLPPQAGQNAGDYLESESDYDGTGCSTVAPASASYPCIDPLVRTDGDLGWNARGRAWCLTDTVDANGYCTGVMRISVHPNWVNSQNTWCHEMGHIHGVKHNTGYGGNCMDNTSSTVYHSHHIQNHMQFQSVSH